MAERNDVALRVRSESGTTPERSAEEIRQDIAAKRESISETVDRLGERIQESLDWREYVSQYPYISLGVAAGIGFLVSGIFKRRPSPRERIIDALAESIEDVTDRFRSSIGDVIPKRVGPGKTVKAAATALVTKAVIDFAKSKAQEAFAGRNQPRQEGRTGSTNAGADTGSDLDADVQASRSSTMGR